jgi:hypothetical protein
MASLLLFNTGVDGVGTLFAGSQEATSWAGIVDRSHTPGCHYNVDVAETARRQQPSISIASARETSLRAAVIGLGLLGPRGVCFFSTGVCFFDIATVPIVVASSRIGAAAAMNDEKNHVAFARLGRSSVLIDHADVPG